MPLTLPYKITLLLDLDETTFIALSELEFAMHGKTIEDIKRFKGIHADHVLSDYIQNSGYYFFVINPLKLKHMIESIYEQGDDIAIFTSGLWLNPILPIISHLCSLSESASKKFWSALFLNPQHDSEKLEYSLKSIQTLLKGYRLHGLFRVVPELRGRHFVLLDNDTNHIASCSSCSYLDGVKATTNTGDTAFYDMVLEKMNLAKTDEVSLSPLTGTYPYPSNILLNFLHL